MMRRVRAKAVISKGLMVVVGMNCFQSGGFADRQGVFLSTSPPLKMF
jgi:hypothetical protein